MIGQRLDLTRQLGDSFRREFQSNGTFGSMGGEQRGASYFEISSVGLDLLDRVEGADEERSGRICFVVMRLADELSRRTAA
jgi:hypothetical protein